MQGRQILYTTRTTRTFTSLQFGIFFGIFEQTVAFLRNLEWRLVLLFVREPRPTYLPHLVIAMMAWSHWTMVGKRMFIYSL